MRTKAAGLRRKNRVGTTFHNLRSVLRNYSEQISRGRLIARLAIMASKKAPRKGPLKRGLSNANKKASGTATASFIEEQL
jgi:hypothetical protein